MAEKVPPRIPAGMRDILPDQMVKRQYVMDVVRAVFEEFGFEPLQTPAIELAETLMGKYGEDAERLIYKAWYGDDPGGELALRYDLSVPLSRVVAMYPDLPRPFKRYQIAPVWRADRPQKGRYREFYQCDVDIVGSASMLADAEIVTVIYEVLRRLGFTDFAISINNRKLLDGIGQYAGVPEALQAGLYRSIDKLDKIGLEGVRRELLMVGVPGSAVDPLQAVVRDALKRKEVGEGTIAARLTEQLQASQSQSAFRWTPELINSTASRVAPQIRKAIDEGVTGSQYQAKAREIAQNAAPEIRAALGQEQSIIPPDVVDRLLDLLQISGPPPAVLADLAARMADYPRAVEGINELRDLFSYLGTLGVPQQAVELNFAMVRGLEYYTGPIYETTIREPKAMPSITGGGRYDELIGMFSDVSYPATGTSLGIERIIDAMDELGMFPPGIRATTAEVLVTVFDASTLGESLRVASALRRAGINTSLYFDPQDRLGDQIGYAAAKGIPFVVILGPDEVSAGQATIRALGETRTEGDQRTVPVGQLAEAIRRW